MADTEDGIDTLTRPVGGTEYGWCKAVPGGTRTTVVGILLSKPLDIPFLQNALHNIQNSHPILRSKLHLNHSTNTYQFVAPPNPQIQIECFDLQSSSQIIALDHSVSDHHDHIDPFHLILEHELNRNTWHDPSDGDSDVICASTYTISDHRWAVFLRLHTSACDRMSAVAVLWELLAQMGGGGGGGGGRVREGTRTEIEVGEGENKSLEMAIEDIIPQGKTNKPFWARGMDLLGYSLNSLRLGNLDFVDPDSPRTSEVVTLQLDQLETQSLIAGCKSRGIKLCGALAAAGMIASWTSKHLPIHQGEKYAVTTLINCRSMLDPVLCSSHLGFYHSAILNTHDVCGKETLWELAKRSYMSFVNAMNCNKHFSDMSDLTFLMLKAIENPGLTPSSSLRTSLISVFEDTVIDDSDEMHRDLGLEDYLVCASVHGVGPSLAIFDTIRDGKLHCACAYPSPLHTREQMQDLVDHIKKILVEGCNSEDQYIGL